MGYNGYNPKHGMFGTRIYRIWAGAKSRCRCETNPDYERYGKQGIKFSEEWDEFEDFYRWAIDNGYGDNLSIDRIDGKGNYEPSNCRWITVKEQQNNLKTNVVIEINGETKTLKQWSEHYNLSYQMVWKRYRKYGWSIEKTLNLV